MTIEPASLVVLLIAAGIVALARTRGLPCEISYKGLLIRFPDPPLESESQRPPNDPKKQGPE